MKKITSIPCGRMAAQSKPNMKRSFIPFTLFCFCIIFLFVTPNTHAQDFFNDALADMERAFNTSEPTLEDAYYLGRAVAANILTVYRPYTQNPDLTRYLNRICRTLAMNSSQPVVFKGYYVIILDSPEINAFASPGGHIFLTRRLVEAATSEDMLAAVIAHELAHIILRHGLSMISDMSIIGEIATTADRATAFSGNSLAAQRLLSFRRSVTTIADTLMKNGYSQHQEFAADRETVAILAATGYNPGALVDMLRILQRTQGLQTGGFNTTHPTPSQRIANVEGVTWRYHVQDTRSYRVPRFRNISR